MFKALDKLESTTLFGTPYKVTLDGDQNDYNVTTISHTLNALFDYINTTMFDDLEEDFGGMGGGDSFGSKDSPFGGSAMSPSASFDDFMGGGGITMPSRMNDMPDDSPF